MASPFTAFANATITFKIGTGEPTYGEFGHLVDELEDFEVTCFLVEKKKSQTDPFDGASQDDIYVEGRCIKPLLLSPDIRSDALGEAIVDGVPFQFRYVATLPSPFFAENKIIGEKIQGYLIKTTTWGGQQNG